MDFSWQIEWTNLWEYQVRWPFHCPVFFLIFTTVENLASSNRRLSGELSISQSTVIRHFHDLSKCIRRYRVVHHTSKIQQKIWLAQLQGRINYFIFNIFDFLSRSKMVETILLYILPCSFLSIFLIKIFHVVNLHTCKIILNVEFVCRVYLNSLFTSTLS